MWYIFAFDIISTDFVIFLFINESNGYLSNEEKLWMSTARKYFL